MPTFYLKWAFLYFLKMFRFKSYFLHLISRFFPSKKSPKNLFYEYLVLRIQFLLYAIILYLYQSLFVFFQNLKKMAAILFLQSIVFANSFNTRKYIYNLRKKIKNKAVEANYF